MQIENPTLKIQIKILQHLFIFYLNSFTFFNVSQILKATDDCDTTFHNFDKEKKFQYSRDTFIFSIQWSDTENEWNLGEKVKKQLKFLKNQLINKLIQ